jgi:Ion channel
VQLSAAAARVVDAFALVLALVLSTYVLASLVPYTGWGGVFITLLGSLTATVALASAQARPRLVAWAGRLSVAAVALSVVGAIAGGRAWYALAAALLTFVFTGGALAVLRAVITEERVRFRTVLGAVSVYIMIGLLYAFLYVAVDRVHHPFFAGSVRVETGDFLFFSLTTLTTTGYGNLVPAGQPGKTFAVLEMLMGQIFLVTLIARLVSMWRPGEWLREGAGLAQPRRRRERL